MGTEAFLNASDTSGFQGLQNIGSDEASKQPEIRAANNSYLKSQEQSFNLQNCAESLSGISLTELLKYVALDEGNAEAQPEPDVGIP